MLKHAGAQVPITGLDFFGSWTLAGQGATLKIYDTSTQELLVHFDAFDSQIITGIKCCEQSGLVLLVAGEYTSVLAIGTDLAIRPVCDPRKCPDWILAAEFCPERAFEGGRSTAALVTAHNALLILEIDTNLRSVQLNSATSQSRCILYAATLSWETQDSILIAAGTCFGHIVVWTANLSRPETHGTLHAVLTGHEGAPFGLYICPVQPSRSRILASCSDDRTLRLWDISGLPVLSSDPHSILDSVISVSGNKISDLLPGSDPAADRERCLAQAVGHTSRAWSVELLSQDEETMLFATFGEDAAWCIWTYERDVRDLRLISQTHNHNGKNIWSHAIARQPQGSFLIATGGADGAIAFDSVHIPHRATNDVSASPWMETKIARPAGDAYRSFDFIASNKLVLSTGSGTVYHYTLYDSSESQAAGPEKLFRDHDLAGYSMMTSIPSQDLAFVVSGSGQLSVVDETLRASAIYNIEGKSAALLACPGEDPQTDTIIVLSGLKSRVAHLLLVKSANDHMETGAPNHTFRLSIPDDDVVSSVTFSKSNSTAHSVALGLRSGCVALYTLEMPPASELVMPTTIHSLHEDSVTDLASFDTGNEHLLISTCRDGSFSCCKVVTKHPRMQINVIHKTSIPDFTEANRAYIRDTDSHVFIAGFKKTHFSVWHANTEQEVFNTKCMGSGRLWTFLPTPDLLGGTLVWSQASELRVYQSNKQQSALIDAGLHGRDVKAMAISDTAATCCQIIATGAEDTDIKLSRIIRRTDGTWSLRCIRTLRKHSTGIQDLAWTEHGDYLVSSGGVEELYVWRVTKCPLLDIGVVCESTCPFLSDVPDLRITAIHVSRDPSASDDGHLRIIACRSDSTVHVYGYSPSAEGGHWACHAAGTYLTCCITGIRGISLHGRERLLTVATDGYAVVLTDAIPGTTDSAAEASRDSSKTAPLLHWTTRFKLHQNAVHCIQSMVLSDGSSLVITGGHDNSLSVTRLGADTSDSKGGILARTLTVPRAHFAALTCLLIISGAEQSLIVDQQHGGGDQAKNTTVTVHVLTASLDQRLKLWRVRVDIDLPGIEGVTVTKVAERASHVADVASMQTLDTGVAGQIGVLLCGVGWEAWTVAKGDVHVLGIGGRVRSDTLAEDANG